MKLQTVRYAESKTPTFDVHVLLLAAWGVPEQTQLISLMRAMQKMIAPDHGFIADPNILGNREKLTRDVQRAGFSHVSCR